VEAAVLAMHAWVAESPARLVVATLDDAAGVSERPNIPGTVDEWANWRIALPAPVEDILDTQLAQRLVEVFAALRGRRSSDSAAA
jgi:4-alpha-glucanotransferase